MTCSVVVVHPKKKKIKKKYKIIIIIHFINDTYFSLFFLLYFMLFGVLRIKKNLVIVTTFNHYLELIKSFVQLVLLGSQNSGVSLLNKQVVPFFFFFFFFCFWSFLRLI